MDVEHHWASTGKARRPDVQLEHVFALPPIVPVLNERLLVSGPSVQILWTVRAVDQSWIFIVPWSRRFSWKPAILTCSGCAIRNAFEGENIARDKTAHFAILRIRNG